MVDAVRDCAPALRWTRLADLHVTTKYIGERAPAGGAAVERALESLRGRAPFRVALSDVGWFPHAGAPRVFWAGVHAPALVELAVATDRALATLGIPRDDRTYAPHLTLARN